MSGAQTRHSPQKVLNLYRAESMNLWRDVEAEIRREYNADEAPEGAVAAQAFAEVLDENGPLDGENA